MTQKYVATSMKKGFIALSTVLVISAVMLAVVGTIAYLSVGEAQSSLALYLGEDNLGLVEGCAEDVLQKVHDNSSYNAASINRPEGTCSIAYTSGGPTTWDVIVTTTTTAYQRKVRIQFTRNPSNISLTSWQEI